MVVEYGPPGKTGVDELWSVDGVDDLGFSVDTNTGFLAVTSLAYLAGTVVKSPFLKDAAIGAGLSALVLRFLGKS